MKPRTIAAALLALALSAGAAAAQSEKRLGDQIVGSWNFVVAEVTAPDGKKSFPFGETPKGILIFTADGRFAQIHVAGDVPKIASNNRLTGTSEEYAAIMRRSLSVFGTYRIFSQSFVDACIKRLNGCRIGILVYFEFPKSGDGRGR